MHASQYCIVLECISPSLRVSVVITQKVMVFHLLPHLYRLLSYYNFDMGPFEGLEERRFSATNVAFNREYSSSHGF